MSSASVPPPATHELAPGTLVADRYRVVSTLGEGGMGIVYLAEHVHMRKRLALKVLLPQWTSIPEVVARFEREAVAAGAIAHPNVAAASDFGRLADGAFFLVLEYLEGPTLRSEIEKGPIAPIRALEIARGITLGVGAAHAKGIIHRDLKPENVMLVLRDADPDFVKVLDFGIARVEVSRTPSGVALTSVGAILGTPDYMAPEQAIGADIDARADLYSLGVILFEMLTGGCPFRGGTMTLLRQQMLTPAPPLPSPIADQLPAEARGLVARLLEKEPSARFATAGQLLAALDASLAALRPSVPSALPVAPTVLQTATPLRVGALRLAQRVQRSPHRRAILGAAAAVGLLGVLAFVYAAVEASASGTGEVHTSAAVEVEIPPPPHPNGAPRATATGTATATPTATGTATGTTPASPSSSPSREKRSTRHTGPGGIYIPPPKTWFK